MMQETVINYKIILKNVNELISISGYRNDYIAKKLGIKPTTFSVKKQRESWTPDEIEKLLSIIKNDETENYYMGLIMESLESDETLSFEEFKKEVDWK